MSLGSSQRILGMVYFWCLILIFVSPGLAEQGCCSSHGGVSGCAGTKLRCKDGAVSPTCGCKGGIITKLASLRAGPPEVRPNEKPTVRSHSTPIAKPDSPTAVQSKNRAKWRCSAKCQLAVATQGTSCEGWVYGNGSGPTEGDACMEAQDDAKTKSPRGCYPRHCYCPDCDKR